MPVVASVPQMGEKGHYLRLLRVICDVAHRCGKVRLGPKAGLKTGLQVPLLDERGGR